MGETEPWEAGVGGCAGTTVVTTEYKDATSQSERPVLRQSAPFISVTCVSSRLLSTCARHAEVTTLYRARNGGDPHSGLRRPAGQR